MNLVSSVRHSPSGFSIPLVLSIFSRLVCPEWHRFYRKMAHQSPAGISESVMASKRPVNTIVNQHNQLHRNHLCIQCFLISIFRFHFILNILIALLSQIFGQLHLLQPFYKSFVFIIFLFRSCFPFNLFIKFRAK